jgi:hypothetical protein
VGEGQGAESSKKSLAFAVLCVQMSVACARKNEKGGPKITRFGLVRAFDARYALCQTSMTLGASSSAAVQRVPLDRCTRTFADLCRAPSHRFE